MILISDRTFGANGFYTSAFPGFNGKRCSQNFFGLNSVSHTELGAFKLNTKRVTGRENVDRNSDCEEMNLHFFKYHTTDVFVPLRRRELFKKPIGELLGFAWKREKRIYRKLQSWQIGSETFQAFFWSKWCSIAQKVDLELESIPITIRNMDGNIFPGAEVGFQASRGFEYIQAMGLVNRIQPIRDLTIKVRPIWATIRLTPEQAQNFEIGANWINQP